MPKWMHEQGLIGHKRTKTKKKKVNSPRTRTMRKAAKLKSK